MTCRERLTNVFTGRPTDRTPITVFITDSDIEDRAPDVILGERGADSLAELLRFHELLGLDVMLRIGTNVFEPIAFDVSTAEWQNTWALLDDNKTLVHEIVTPGGVLREVFNTEGEDFHGDYSQNWMKLRNIRMESLVKGQKELDLIREFRPSMPELDLAHVGRARERLGEKGILLPRVPSGVFNYAVGLMDAEDLLLKPLLEPDFYAGLMNLCTDDVIPVGEHIAQSGGDVVRVVANIANSGLVGPAFYEEHILPYEKRYIDALAAAGGRVLFHNCGQCASLLPVYREMLDGHALESLSAPGSGGDIDSLRSAREALGDGVVMVGNFDQISLLKDGTPEAIRQEVFKIREETRGDLRFIFSTSDSIIPGTPKNNIEALAHAAREAFH